MAAARSNSLTSLHVTRKVSSIFLGFQVLVCSYLDVFGILGILDIVTSNTVKNSRVYQWEPPREPAAKPA